VQRAETRSDSRAHFQIASFQFRGEIFRYGLRWLCVLQSIQAMISISVARCVKTCNWGGTFTCPSWFLWWCT
jgi:hypothetical protein